ncbi:MAG: HAD hydrolase family protein [Planctomycetota bacterium]
MSAPPAKPVHHNKYRLLGIDLDGTLLQPDQTILKADRDAVHDALEAGMVVVPCTGRAWHESRHAVKQLDGLSKGLDEGVFVTGALVTKLACGTVRDHASFAPELVQEIVDVLADLPEAVLVFRVPDRIDHDYLVTGRGEMTPNTKWWFESSGARVVERPVMSEADRNDCVRVAVVSTLPDMSHFVADMQERFAGRIESHSFEGVERVGEQDPVQILEVFPAGCSKWRGLRAVAEKHGIDDTQIAMIGDQVNDLPAISAAGLGVAMGNAIDAVKDVADRVSLPNADAGVAHAIRQMLDGRW